MLLKDVKTIIREANVDPALRSDLEQKGYRYLDAGIDQEAYLAPDGSIFKIFGRSNDPDESHRMFGVWYDFCEKNKHSHLVPHFLKYRRFRSDYDGKVYLQIKMERLFKLPNHLEAEFEDMIGHIVRNSLEDFLDYMSDEKQNFSKTKNTSSRKYELLATIESAEELWKMVRELKQIARLDGNWALDLHSQNVMLDDQGMLVIVDPWINLDG